MTSHPPYVAADETSDADVLARIAETVPAR